jgi:hypothetical protein
MILVNDQLASAHQAVQVSMVETEESKIPQRDRASAAPGRADHAIPRGGIEAG